MIINVTHLRIRSKCPKDFTLVGRSADLSKTPRGGVAIFKNVRCDLDIELVYDGLQDCVMCRVRNTDLMIIALYIPPSNSTYFKDEYFSNLDLIYNRFRSYVFLIMGDLNPRVGTPTYDTDLRYFDNPDSTINSNGMKLLNWLKGKKDAFIVNGLVTDQKNSDSKFTFFRGNLRSQNDLLISNSQNILKSFTISNKHTHLHVRLYLLILNALWTYFMSVLLVY